MRRGALWGIAGAIALIAVALVTRSSAGAAASTLSRGPLGWLGFARLLESRGIELTRLDRGLEHLDPILDDPGTLFVAFPWQRASLAWEPAPVVGFVRRGGRLVLATSGASPSFAERALLDALGVGLDPRPGSRPLRPVRWWRERRAGASWAPAEAVPWRAPLRTGALGVVARPPRETGATALAVDEDGAPVASVFALGEGEVWLLPSQALANAWLGEPGNAALALALAARLEGRAVFDELHHGLVGGAASADGGAASRSFDAVVLQLFLVWSVALLAIGWRFGPPWRVAEPPADAHRSYLVGLGALHHRLGHDREAARALVRRVAAWAPSRLPPDRVERWLERAGTVPFHRLARELSRTPEETPDER